MKITYLGHSSFLLETASGVRAVTDPYGGVGFSMPPVTADVVTVSHGHYDHCNVSAVGGSPAVFSSPGKYRAGDLEISAFACFHDDAHGAKRGGNLAFRFAADGITLCHLGDIGEPCTPQFVQKLLPVDVLLLPVGGNYTVDARGAMEYAEAISPSVVIPMHYKVDKLRIDISDASQFLGLCRGKAKIAACGPELELKPQKNAEKEIIVMERKIK